MGIPLSANFDLGTGIPLDSRLVKADITARNALNTVTQRYEGMVVFVVDTEKNYQLRGDVEDANWVELIDTGEPALGNPGADGYVLSSTAAGVRSWIVQSSGVVPVSDILYWNSATSKYTPYAAQTTDTFDIGTVDPVHTNRLNYDGYFFATRLYGDLYRSDGSLKHLTVSAGNASGAAGTDAGNLILRAGNALAADTGSEHGNIYLVPGNHNTSGQAGYVYLGDESSNFNAIFITAAGVSANVDIDIMAKGTGQVSLWAGNNITLTALNGISAQLGLFTLGLSPDTSALFTAYSDTTEATGMDLIIKAGDVIGSGNWNGGALYLKGGAPTGSGIRGNVYFGSGAAGYLPAKAAETSIIYYDSTTGKISYATAPVGMAYPGAGIALSSGSAWSTSITNNSANWNTAYGWGDWAATVALKAPLASPTFTGTVTFPVSTNVVAAGGYKIFWRSANANISYSGTVDWHVNNNADTVALFTVLDGGKVGIGIASPGTELHIKKADAAITLEGATNQYLLQIVDSTNRFRIYDNTGSGERFTVGSTGNVGINNNAPGSRLDVTNNNYTGTNRGLSVTGYQTSSASTDPLVLITNNWEKTNNAPVIFQAKAYDDTAGSFIIKGNGDVGIGNNGPTHYSGYIALNIGANASGKTGILQFSSTYNSGDGAQIYQSAASGMIYVYSNNATQVMNIAAAGAATFVSTITATNFILSSDERLKINISSFNPHPVNIEYKKFEMKNEPGQVRYGVMAQDLVKHYPELIRTNEEGIMSVTYFDLIIREIAYLKDKVMELEGRLGNGYSS